MVVKKKWDKKKRVQKVGVKISGDTKMGVKKSGG